MTHTRIKPTDKSDAVEFPSVKELILYKISPVMMFSCISGVIIGFVVTFFNMLLTLIGEGSDKLIALMSSDLKLLPLYVLMAASFAFAAYFLIKLLPEAKGSGIPRTEAAILGKKNLTWWKMAAATFLGSMLSFGAGLSVGAEGPSVQMGAGIAGAFEKLNGKTNGKHMYRRYLAGAGAGAGVAAAFGAPFTGLLFVQEEILRKFNPLMIAACSASIIFGNSVHAGLSHVFGIENFFFPLASSMTMPLEYLWTALIMGVMCALFAKLFNTAVIALDTINRKSKIHPLFLLVSVFCVTSVINVFLPSSAGSGHPLANALVAGGVGWKLALIVLLVKTVLVLFCFRSGATGGMMVPMLTLGALLGGLIGWGCAAAGMPEAYIGAAAAVTMCVFFGSAIGAPFTAAMLFLETTGGVGALCAMLIATLVSMVAGRLLRQRPLYDVLAEREADKRMLNVF